MGAQRHLLAVSCINKQAATAPFMVTCWHYPGAAPCPYVTWYTVVDDETGKWCNVDGGYWETYRDALVDFARRVERTARQPWDEYRDLMESLMPGADVRTATWYEPGPATRNAAFPVRIE